MRMVNRQANRLSDVPGPQGTEFSRTQSAGRRHYVKSHLTFIQVAFYELTDKD